MAILEKPRRVLIMVPAGPAVDSAIAHVKPHMEPGDILIDGGNSFFQDTERRSQELATEGFNFVGMGVSGGEEGALWGPSLMPGGQREAWEALEPILKGIAAKSEDGEPCVEYMGPRGAGHYVKMVHNGIEYGDMQLIAEAYDILHRGAGLSALELSKIFAEWKEGVLSSYLIEITAEILSKVDPDSGQPLVDVIMDEAQQKGTGKWTSQNALDIGAPTPTMNAAVESRIHSHARHLGLTGILRRLPQRAPARQPDPGATRLFRRAHLSANRPRRRLPYGMDDQTGPQGLNP
jgi:6-phosphogluconate dehydrogenase